MKSDSEEKKKRNNNNKKKKEKQRVADRAGWFARWRKGAEALQILARVKHRSICAVCVKGKKKYFAGHQVMITLRGCSSHQRSQWNVNAQTSMRAHTEP